MFEPQMTQVQHMENTAPPTDRRPRPGLAIAALTLGILAVFSSILLVGAFLGVLAILLGAVHLSKRRGANGMAWAGIGLAVLSIALSTGLGMLYIKGFKSLTQEWTTATPLNSAAEPVPAFADWIGRELPEFTLRSLDGQQLDSAKFRGRRVVLDFWATWCPPCRQEIPHFIQLAEENPREELLIIGISDEDEEILKKFVAKEGINYPIVSAEDLPAPFDSIQAIPTTFFIDRTGRIQKVVIGYHDYDHLKELALAEDLPPEDESDAQTDQP